MRRGVGRVSARDIVCIILICFVSFLFKEDGYGGETHSPARFHPR
jgi:hypothetical protein